MAKRSQFNNFSSVEYVQGILGVIMVAKTWFFLLKSLKMERMTSYVCK